MKFNNSYGNFLNTFMSFKVWREYSVEVGVDLCILFWIIFVQRGVLLLDCSRDILGFTCSVIWVQNTRYLILQSHAKRELLNFFWHLGKESSFLGKKMGFVWGNQESNGCVELELQRPFVENREGHHRSFWSECSEDIYFEFLVAVTWVNMLSVRCRIKTEFYGENKSNNSLKILMMPEWQKMVDFFAGRWAYAKISDSFTLQGFNGILRYLTFDKGSNDIHKSKLTIADNVWNYTKSYLNFIPQNHNRNCV